MVGNSSKGPKEGKGQGHGSPGTNFIDPFLNCYGQASGIRSALDYANSIGCGPCEVFQFPILAMAQKKAGLTISRLSISSSLGTGLLKVSVKPWEGFHRRLEHVTS